MEKLWITLCTRCGKAVDNSPHPPSHTLPSKEIYKLTPLRGALGALVILCAGGCTVVQEKGERYQAVMEKFWNAGHVEIHYKREGENLSGWEYRCFGEACKTSPMAESSRISDN